eukprot:366112-Chlamydomonas_euryale.AAC.27
MVSLHRTLQDWLTESKTAMPAAVSSQPVTVPMPMLALHDAYVGMNRLSWPCGLLRRPRTA